jgi:hypothetical protein
MTEHQGSAGWVAARRGEGGAVHVVLAGAVDSTVAEQLASCCQQALLTHPDRLDLDLSAVTAMDPPAVAVVAWCLAAGRHLRRGVRVGVATAAGRRALLEATSQV